MTTSRTTVSNKTSTRKTASSDKPAPKARSTATAKPRTTTTPAATPSKPRASRKTAKSVEITPEQRYQLIAMAAYYRAERRGFTRGGELDDWIAAEQEIDAMLKS